MTLTPVQPYPGSALLDHGPLPLPVGGWGAAEAHAAVEEARLVVDLPPTELICALTTVVLRAGDWAVKVFPPGTDSEHLAAVARALCCTDTVVVPHSGPIVTSGGIVTVSPWLSGAHPATWPRVGTLLRRFHDETAGTSLPEWVPLRRLTSQVHHLRAEQAEVLLAARADLLGALAEVRSVLGPGVIHGDVSPWNVLSGTHGSQFIDLDFAAWGPREYDLASAARRWQTGELETRTYRKFCRRYGFDVVEWDGLPLLNRIAELSALAFRIWDSMHHGRSLDWVDNALADWATAV